jgi:fatty-acyl-CoA synthase
MKPAWSCHAPDRTAEAIDDAGWIHTGDLALLDAEGYCNIVERVNDTIIRDDENIYPREIEEFPYQYPKVLDVVVVGRRRPQIRRRHLRDDPSV